MKRSNKSESEILRQKAEELLRNTPIPVNPSEADTLKLFHELQVHQIELELQNKELNLARSAALLTAEKYTELYDFAPSGYFTLSKEGKITELNLSGASMLGKERLLLRNSRFGFFVSNDTKPAFNLFLGNLFKSKAKAECEITLTPNANSPIDVHLTAIYSGEKDQCHLTVVDITERKQMENELKQSETKFRNLFESANDAIFIMDDKVFRDCNTKTEIVFGCGQDDIIGHSPAEFSPLMQPDGRLSSEKSMEKIHAALKGNPQFFYWQHQRYDGTPIDAEVSLNKIEIGGEECLQAIVRDISDQKRIENDLKSSLSLLEVTLESIHNGILTVSREGAVIKTNATFADMWQIPEAVLSSSDDKVLLNHVMSQLSDPEEFIAKVNELYENPESETFDLINFKDGRIFERISKPMMLEGKPKGRVWSFLDVTKRTKSAEALRDEQWRLESIVEATRAGTWEWNVQTGEAVFNSLWAGMVGYTLDELLPTNIKVWESLVHPDDLLKSNNLLDRHYSGELPYYDLECRMKHKDGHWVWIHDRGRVLTRTSEGKPLMMLGTHTDISDRKQAEEQLLISQRNFNQLVNQLSDIIWQSNGDGTEITDLNNSFEKVYGFSAKEFNSHPNLWVDLVHPDDRKIAEESGRELSEKGNTIAEYRIRRPDGKIKWIKDRKSILYDQDGKPVQMGGMASDITDRKLLEEQLQIKNFAIDASPTALGLADFNGKIFYVNDAFIKLWGYDNKTEVIGKPISALSFSKESSEPLFAFLKHGAPISAETECLRKNGTVFTSLLSAGVITSTEGNSLCMMALFIDITEQKKKEAEINSMNEQLIQANAEKDKFFSIIAHDLRSPFNGFLGLTRIMVDELDSLTINELQKMAVSMRNSATNLFSLLENLLEWSRIRRGVTTFEPEPISLISIISESLKSISEPATKKGIEIRYHIPDDLIVYADGFMLRSTIRNLTYNALKFTLKGGGNYHECQFNHARFC